MRQTFIRVIPWLAALILSAAASAQTFPLSIQGKLTGVPDGQQSMTLRIWDAATEGNEVASVPFVAEVNGGVFSSVIDTPTSAFSGADRWWSVQCGLTQTAPERVASVPFAISTRSIHGHTYHGVLTGQGFQATSGAFGEWGFHGGFSDGAFPNWLNSGRIGDLKCLIGNTRFSGLASVNGPALDSTIVFIMANWDWNAFQVRGIYDGGSRISGPAYFTVRSTGDVGIGTESPQAKLDVRGTTRTSVLVITGGSDLAEPFSESTDSDIDAKPGMVMSIDPANPGALRIATAAYDTRVAGVYSGGNNLPTGMIMGKEGCDLTAPGDDKIPLAMTGRVWVYADESNGAITPGDRLTTSGSKPGHAMKATDRDRWDGAVIGKAMTSVDPESGMVMVLVNLQ